jgi:hypothetical protein
MAFEPKDNSGSIFVNDKGDNPKRPDRKGQAMIGGVEYWVKGWLKKTKDGDPFLSLSFEPKGEMAKPTTSKMQPRSMKDELDDGDSIPF